MKIGMASCTRTLSVTSCQIVPCISGKMSNHKCEECDYVGRAKANLIIHKSRKHKCNLVKCIYCDFTTDERHLLELHEKHTHNDNVELPSVRYRCHRCTYVTSNEPDMRQHLCLTRHGQILDSYLCSECNFETRVKRQVEFHTNQKHHVRNLYKCGECYTNTVTQNALLEHILIHTVSRNVSEVRRSADLKMHAVRKRRDNSTSQNAVFRAKRVVDSSNRAISLNEAATNVHKDVSQRLATPSTRILPKVKDIVHKREHIVTLHRYPSTHKVSASISRVSSRIHAIVRAENASSTQYLPNIQIKQEYPDSDVTDTSKHCNDSDIVIKKEPNWDASDALDTAVGDTETLTSKIQRPLVRPFLTVNVKSETPDVDMTPFNSAQTSGSLLKAEHIEVECSPMNYETDESLPGTIDPLDIACQQINAETSHQADVLPLENVSKQKEDSEFNKVDEKYEKDNSKPSDTVKKTDDTHPGTIFMCPYCKRIKRNRSLLLQHFRVAHGKQKDCEVKEYALKTKWNQGLKRTELNEVRLAENTNTRQDVKIITGSNRATFLSSDAGSKATQAWVKDTFGTHECAGCSYRTRHVDELYRHLRTAHAVNSVLYKCVRCTYSTRLRAMLSRHVKLKHAAAVDEKQAPSTEQEVTIV